MRCLVHEFLVSIHASTDIMRAIHSYCLSVALCFQRFDPIRYSPYLDQYLRALEAEQEYETDLYLVNLVRIQHLTERISRLHAKDHVEDDLPGIARAPLDAYMVAFQGELDRYRNELPPHLQQNSK